ncbi:VOC family protein [Cellulomonas endophytica]|uniref:VOC family protein n=1 Tax=Cellulomonas endophytica TaxID=2494735 RepID=UPI001011A93F|nr:VOC family protein [Cellulomonas endophytica]
MRPWPGPVTAVTLLVEDLAAARRFYSEVFGLPVAFEDDVSAVFRFGDLMVNLLQTGEAFELFAPALPGAAGSAPRVQLTLTVDDVDEVCARLRERGVELLNGPVDRPWGIRTAAFRDPAGHVWEVAG